jgi:serine protease Do
MVHRPGALRRAVPSLLRSGSARRGCSPIEARAAAEAAVVRGRVALAALLLSFSAAVVAAPPSRTTPTAPKDVGCAAPPGFSAALERALPVTVGIYAVGRPSLAPAAAPVPMARAVPPSEGAAPVEGAEEGRIGAGFVVDRAGLIATAAHVVVDARRIVVKLADQRVAAAELLGADEDSDIALLHVPLTLPEPALASSKALRAGDWVLAVGEPYGFSRSVAAGVVGGVDRHLAEEPELLFIQSDLAINPGNSGGPLLDASGAVVGMNSRTMIGSFGAVGVSLSVPIEIVMQVVGELRNPPASPRPRLGAAFQDVSAPAALAAGRSHAQGALIGDVLPGGLAERMGLQAGDIVVGMDGRGIGDSAELAHALLGWRHGAGTRVTVWRRRAYVELAAPR